MSKLGYRDMVFDPRAVVWVKPLPKIQPRPVPRFESALPEPGNGVLFEVFDARASFRVFWKFRAPNEALAWLEADRLCLRAGYDRRAVGLRRAVEERDEAPVVRSVDPELRNHVRAALLGQAGSSSAGT